MVSSSEVEGANVRVGLAEADVRAAGVGPRVTLMRCSIPVRHIDSISSPLKKAMRRDLSCWKRGCVSNSSEAKWINGLCPGVAFAVYKPTASN